MALWHHGTNRRRERGQILLMLAAVIPVLLLFLGLAVDFGLIYAKQAALARGVDAAALAGMRSLNEGVAAATTIAQDEFALNYPVLGNDPVAPVFNFAASTGSNNNMLVNVSATATVHPLFLSMLPGFQTVQFSASAQTTRAELIMSLVLDVSTSMTENGGSTALAPAVQSFISDFDPTNTDMTDLASMVTFGTTSKVNVAMQQPFKNAIDNATSGFNFGSLFSPNYTNSTAGLTAAQSAINGVTVPAGQNVTKVAVFFTDGWPNINQDNLTCSSRSGTLTNLLYCGCDTGDESLGLCTANNLVFFSPTACTGNGGVACSAATPACGATTFPAQQPGNSTSLSNTNACSSDAMYRAIQVAKSMLAQNIYVYSIGMGSAITNQPTAEDFLRQVANDPASSTFNPNEPIGEAVFASDSAQLTQVFQTIASKILLRITQ